MDLNRNKVRYVQKMDKPFIILQVFLNSLHKKRTTEDDIHILMLDKDVNIFSEGDSFFN